jgi:hypothetical protein
MPGRIYLRQHIYRSDLILNPNVLFIFGDNMLRIGLGGQAREMRGQPNAIGIPTKQSPGTAPHDYFINSDLQNARIRGEINKGLSQLEQRAPEILHYIELHIRYLYEITENTHHFSQNPVKEIP